VLSGTPVRRPSGQLDEGKTYGPCRKLDYELEVGVFVGGPGNAQGEPMSVHEAREAIFGYVLLNDWSARDVQAWEYVPLGPFCAKNFATTISPWIVPAEALEGVLGAPVSGPVQQPLPLPYLRDAQYVLPDVGLSARLRTSQGGEVEVCQTSMRCLYWTPAQMLAHHSSTGCNMRPGDLLGTGTISGPTPQSVGSLLELSWNGTKPIELSRGQTRTFLQDGDEIVLRGFAQVAQGRVGFGECAGRILPAAPGKL
jgi:fumarylacetoacetase